MNPLQPFLGRQGFVMLDGALATELEKHGADLANELWSARTLVDAPEIITAVNGQYLTAGADIIATATYQASFAGFAKAGFNHDKATSLMLLSVDLACLARENFWSNADNRRGRLKPLVAASIGPYGACQSDGSEYHGNYGLSKQELIDFHRPRLALLVQSHADLLAFETIPSILEAEALIELLAEFPQARAWLSFSCKNESQVCHGESFADCNALAEGSDQILATGINCTSPEYVTALMRSSGAKKPLVVYPNSGEEWVSSEWRWKGGACTSLDAREWYDAGARLIGGCCRTSPADISRMKADLIEHLA
jgi:homocysteine S-methyltransferase